MALDFKKNPPLRYPIVEPLFHESYLEAQNRLRFLVDHYRRVDYAKSTVDDNPPVNIINVRLKLKRLLCEGERLAKIEKDNKFMLTNILNVMRSPATVDHYHRTNLSAHCNTLNFTSRKLEASRISRENCSLLERIRKTKTSYPRVMHLHSYYHMVRSTATRAEVFKLWNRLTARRKKMIMKGQKLEDVDNEALRIKTEQTHRYCFPVLHYPCVRPLAVPRKSRHRPETRGADHTRCLKPCAARVKTYGARSPTPPATRRRARFTVRGNRATKFRSAGVRSKIETLVPQPVIMQSRSPSPKLLREGRMTWHDNRGNRMRAEMIKHRLDTLYPPVIAPISPVVSPEPLRAAPLAVKDTPENQKAFVPSILEHPPEGQPAATEGQDAAGTPHPPPGPGAHPPPPTLVIVPSTPTVSMNEEDCQPAATEGQDAAGTPHPPPGLGAHPPPPSLVIVPSTPTVSMNEEDLGLLPPIPESTQGLENKGGPEPETAGEAAPPMPDATQGEQPSMGEPGKDTPGEEKDQNQSALVPSPPCTEFPYMLNRVICHRNSNQSAAVSPPLCSQQSSVPVMKNTKSKNENQRALLNLYLETQFPKLVSLSRMPGKKHNQSSSLRPPLCSQFSSFSFQNKTNQFKNQAVLKAPVPPRYAPPSSLDYVVDLRTKTTKNGPQQKNVQKSASTPTPTVVEKPPRNGKKLPPIQRNGQDSKNVQDIGATKKAGASTRPQRLEDKRCRTVSTLISIYCPSSPAATLLKPKKKQQQTGWDFLDNCQTWNSENLRSKCLSTSLKLQGPWSSSTSSTKTRPSKKGSPEATLTRESNVRILGPGQEFGASSLWKSHLRFRLPLVALEEIREEFDENDYDDDDDNNEEDLLCSSFQRSVDCSKDNGSTGNGKLGSGAYCVGTNSEVREEGEEEKEEEEGGRGRRRGRGEKEEPRINSPTDNVKDCGWQVKDKTSHV